MHYVVAQVWRGDFLESVHHGTVLAVDAGGRDEVCIGEVDAAMYPRSANKPLQAVGMLRAGLDLDGELLALVCASHSGQDFHLEGVRAILRGAGLAVDDLRNTPGLPLDEQARDAWVCAGRRPESLSQNCSGKHAGMLAACVIAGWDTRTYLEPAHPLQQLIRAAVEDLAGEPVASVGVDGCGAPLFGFSLRGLARAFARIAGAAPGTPEHRVAAAMSAYPDWVGGTRRDVTALMRAIPGAIAKDGAEGVLAVGLADGSSVALKILDGTRRARPVVAVAALRRLGVDHLDDVDRRALDTLAEAPVLGHGRPVGAVRPTQLLRPGLRP